MGEGAVVRWCSGYGEVWLLTDGNCRPDTREHILIWILILHDKHEVSEVEPDGKTNIP